MIRNVIFDIGGVFVRWSPSEVIRRCFDLPPDSEENRRRTDILFRSPIWTALNLGELTQTEAELAYQAQLGLTEQETSALFFHVMDHQVLIEGTADIARRLRQAGYRVFAVTDNVREIMAHLKTRYIFWDLFHGTVVSAEVGMRKPQQAIFHYTLTTYGLAPSETVFFDDHRPNVEGARSIGMEAFLFTTPSQCEHDLLTLGLVY
jgi:putative hydrolase of the HAD superfamily